MKIFIIILSILLLNLNAEDNIWSKDTKSMSKQKSDKIITAYEDGNLSEFHFEDDPEVKVLSDVENNILVVGLSLGYGASNEEVSNKSGSYDTSYTGLNTKFTLGKDFTFWHKEYTEPTRLYLTYAYTKLSTDADYTTWTFGLRENMSYWPIYKSAKSSLYPSLSYELGQSNMKRGTVDISGFTTEINTGLVYRRGGFEYIVNATYNQIAWNHPIDGIQDESKSFQLNAGVNYRWMHGE